MDHIIVFVVTFLIASAILKYGEKRNFNLGPIMLVIIGLFFLLLLLAD